MIKSVGIDLAVSGEHRVRCLDERAQPCDGFDFETSSDGLAKLEERIFEKELILSSCSSLPDWHGY